ELQWAGSYLIAATHGRGMFRALVTTTPTVNLSVTKTGSGTVTSSPTGIDCGTTCSGSFASNSVVTLNAIPSLNYVFTGWSGGGCAGTNPCVLTITGNKSVAANF